MEPKNISKDELREIMKEAVTSVLAERKDLLEEAVSEAILDMKLGVAVASHSCNFFTCFLSDAAYALKEATVPYNVNFDCKKAIPRDENRLL